MFKTALVIPTLNGGNKFAELLNSLRDQHFIFDRRIVIDSGSKDDTVLLAKNNGFDVLSINPVDFNHGGTRQLVVNMLSDIEIIIFVTQDVIISRNDSLQKLVSAFNNPSTGAAYGRQLPHTSAKVIGAHARYFNYPPKSIIKSFEDRAQLGIKTTFISNSFAAYRREALIAMGGFPEKVILSEDTYVAAKMLLAGWKIAYCADAQVHHSHDYDIISEFRRYFDTGVFYGRERWIRDTFGGAEGEGVRFLLSEIKCIWHQGSKMLIPVSILRNALKFIAFQLGLRESRIPKQLIRRMSMHKGFWN